jgi:predicted outer membrane repeat protein
MDILSQVTLPVPAYLWRHGCGPTAVGMVVGYYDTIGYSVLIPGSAASQTSAVNQAIASGGTFSSPYPSGSERHYEDYARPEDEYPNLLDDDYITQGRTAHVSNCIADYMDTSKSTRGNYYGWSWSDDVGPAFVNYIHQQDPKSEKSYQEYLAGGTLTWSVLTGEIDAGRPMVFLVDTDGDGGTDHFVAVVGYRTSPSNQYGCFDTWYPPVRWENFTPMSKGVQWGIWGGWALKLKLAPNHPPNTPTLVSPGNGATEISPTSTLQASSFSDPDGDSHESSQWQVSRNSDFTDIAWDSGESIYLTQTTIPSGPLTGNTTYYWRVRYKDNRSAWSSWASPWSFTTREVTQIYVNVNATGANNGSSWADAYTDLQSALTAAVDGDEIWVAAGTYVENIRLKDGVALYGGFYGNETELSQRNWNVNETIIDGNKQGSVVTSPSGTKETTRIDGFTIRNGQAIRGGGMYNYQSSPTVNNCTFSNNSASTYGGGMYNDFWTSPTVNNCTFRNNSAYDGGGGMGNAAYTSPTLTNCTFTNNSARRGGGGGMYSNGSPTITNCTFSGNSASNGGGMYGGSLTVENCTFSGNSASNGGGMYGSSLTVENCTFSGNSAKYGGGGMYNNGSQTITNCTFSGNSASDGGGMHNQYSSNPMVINCIFSRNTANSDGGGMYNSDYSRPNVNNCTFSGNSANKYGGGMYNYFFTRPDVNTCTFSGNSADKYGGGIYNEYYSGPTVNNCTFTANQAYDGGGIYDCNYSSPTLTDCNFSDNTASSPDGGGGGMYNYRSYPTVTNCTLTTNQAYDGGGMYNDESGPTINNCTFSANSANSDGGGMYNEYYSSPNVNNCTFNANSANSGGGMYNYDSSSPTVNNCTFTDNTAASPDRGGGGMYNGEESNPTVEGCTFSGNSAEWVGGGMYNYYYSSPTITNCTFSNNSAGWSGGMDNSYDSNPTVKGCIFSDNLAIYSGGGMGNWDVGNPTVKGCTFTGNSALYGGGMINGQAINATLANCTFLRNSAIKRGGAMVNSESDPTLINCKFCNNSALWSGGGLYNYDGHTEVSNCILTGNYSELGGGIHCFGSGSVLTNCTLSRNYALQGNALACDSLTYNTPSNLQVINCILWDGGDELLNDDGSSIAITYSDVQGGWTGTGNIDADPCFVEMGYWDPNGTPADSNDDFWVEGNYHLQPASLCINAGDPNYVAEPNEIDFDGEARVMFARVDMGADEFNPIHLGIVNKKRVSRTEFAYDCNATFTNLWPFAVTNVELQMMQAPENMTIIEPNVTFGDIEFGTRLSITSIDTCTFQVDRSKAIEPDKIVWKVKCQMADTGMPIELTCAGALADDGKIGFEDLAALAGKWLWVGEAGSIPEDITGDGIVNLRDFAELAANPQ